MKSTKTANIEMIFHYEPHWGGQTWYYTGRRLLDITWRSFVDEVQDTLRKIHNQISIKQTL